MKKFLAAIILVSSLSAVASSVKITSFNYVRLNNELNHPLAEICGRVEGAVSFPTFIRILIDPKSSQPASYNTLADQNGKFCMSVITFKGSAEVSIMGQNSPVDASIN